MLVTTTSCQPISTSIRRSPGIATHCCSRRAAQRMGAFSRKVGPTSSARSIPKNPLHVLVLHAEPLGARWRSASRPHSAKFRFDERLQSAGVDRHIRGLEDASDHAPVWVELRDAPNRPASASLVGGQATTAALSSSKAKKSARRTDGEIKRQTRVVDPSKPKPLRRPLLVIDGDSFAHRSYHALPKTIRRSDGKGAGAIVGFANFLLRVYTDERPRAVIVGWDSLDAPTKRHEMLPAYQSGREFAEELIEQLNVLAVFVAAFGFSYAKAPGFTESRTDFSRRRGRRLRSASRRVRIGGKWRVERFLRFHSWPHYVQ